MKEINAMADQGNENPEKGTAQIDQVRLQMLVEEMKSNQNLLFGVFGGVVAAAIGAAVWGMISALSHYQIGWMAVGVGFLVGFAVRTFGKGMDTSFGVIGAILSLLGCLAGNLLTACITLSRQEGIPFFNLLSHLNPEITIGLMKATFSPMDLLFYAIAVYEGYKFSFRRISGDQLSKLIK